MDFLVRFAKDIYVIVKSPTKEMARAYLKSNYDLRQSDYGIVEANADDVSFVGNESGIIIDVSVPPITLYKEATGK